MNCWGTRLMAKAASVFLQPLMSCCALTKHLACWTHLHLTSFRFWPTPTFSLMLRPRTRYDMNEVTTVDAVLVWQTKTTGVCCRRTTRYMLLPCGPRWSLCCLIHHLPSPTQHIVICCGHCIPTELLINGILNEAGYCAALVSGMFCRMRFDYFVHFLCYY